MRIGREFHHLDDACHSTISTGKGVAAAFVTGYKEVVQCYPDAIVVRLDTAEHPVDRIPELIEKVKKVGGMVIGDLSFTKETLIPGTFDRFLHLQLFPALYRALTKNQVAVSCAFGFNVFAPGVCGRILDGALAIMEKAGELLETPMQWGFDGAMVLSALKEGTSVIVHPVPATTVRNRAVEKGLAQWGQHAVLGCAVWALWEKDE